VRDAGPGGKIRSRRIYIKKRFGGAVGTLKDHGNAGEGKNDNGGNTKERSVRWLPVALLAVFGWNR